MSPKAFDEDMHFSDGGSPLMAQYLLVVDALNFCFWPGEGGGEDGEERPALVDRMHAGQVREGTGGGRMGRGK